MNRMQDLNKYFTTKLYSQSYLPNYSEWGNVIIKFVLFKFIVFWKYQLH